MTAVLPDLTQDPEELFGTGEDAERRYRELLKATHPDRHDGNPEATRAFQHLQTLWETHQTHLATAEKTITSGDHTYTLTGRTWTGEITTTAEAHREDGTPVHIKTLDDETSTDLFANELTNLYTLQVGDERWSAYHPQHPQKTTVDGKETIIYHAPEGLWTLQEIKRRRPYGLDPRDAAWMWRRALVALGAAHRCDLVHGAVWAENIAIHPAEHGLVLLNWHLAAPIGEKIPALTSTHRHQYPPEILNGQSAGPASDIAMLATTMEELIGPQLPAPLQAHIKGCTQPNPQRRPQDPWGELEELDELLERLYGKRRYRPFTP